MQITGENTELGTSQPGFVVDGAVDTRWTRKIMYFESFSVLLLKLPLGMAVMPEHSGPELLLSKSLGFVSN